MILWCYEDRDLVYPTGFARRWFSSRPRLPVLLCIGLVGDDLGEPVAHLMCPDGRVERVNSCELIILKEAE
jgi:hypothetical protein